MHYDIGIPHMKGEIRLSAPAYGRPGSPMQERRAHSGGAGARPYTRISPTRVNRHGAAYLQRWWSRCRCRHGRRIAPPGRLRNRPHTRQKCSARAKEPYCRPNTRSSSAVPREALHNPRRSTWGSTSETISASMPLTTRETRHNARTST